MRPPPRPALLAAALSLLPAVAAAQKISNPDLFGKSLEVSQKALELFGASEDQAARERVAEIGYRVAQGANFEDFPFTFHVVEMPAPNAFALPGGHVFVTRGMLELGLTDAMLAGLLGHEIAHVVRQHGTRMERRATLMQVLSQALVVGVLVGARNQGDREGVRAPYDPRDPAYSETASTVQGVAATSIVVSELLLRGYSRDFEREADDEGQRYAAAAGYQPAGLRELMALMEVRLPTSKEYGYWQTHPFFDERVRGAQTRAELLKAQSGRDAADYRRRTQEVLLGYLDGGKAPAEAVALLKADALLAWPRGPRADGIRHEGLTERRDSELAQAPLARDYGALLRAYREGIAELERLDRESPLIATLRDELGELTRQARDLYPEAVKVVEGEVHETPFLEQFLSNYPDSAEVPKVALALGDAEARLGRQAEAVAHYLEAWEAGPDSSAGQRARMGLRNLAPTLDSLAALEQLAQQQDDAELASLARSRLAPVAGSFTDLANGAEYLRRYPDGELAATVTARLNSLADDLYAEVVLYQGVGDSVKALDRINQILTHAPASPAAEQIRDRAVVRG